MIEIKSSTNGKTIEPTYNQQHYPTLPHIKSIHTNSLISKNTTKRIEEFIIGKVTLTSDKKSLSKVEKVENNEYKQLIEIIESIGLKEIEFMFLSDESIASILTKTVNNLDWIPVSVNSIHTSYQTALAFSKKNFPDIKATEIHKINPGKHPRIDIMHYYRDYLPKTISYNNPYGIPKELIQELQNLPLTTEILQVSSETFPLDANGMPSLEKYVSEGTTKTEEDLFPPFLRKGRSIKSPGSQNHPHKIYEIATNLKRNNFKFDDNTPKEEEITVADEIKIDTPANPQKTSETYSNQPNKSTKN